MDFLLQSAVEALGPWWICLLDLRLGKDEVNFSAILHRTEIFHSVWIPEYAHVNGSLAFPPGYVLGRKCESNYGNVVGRNCLISHFILS